MALGLVPQRPLPAQGAYGARAAYSAAARAPTCSIQAPAQATSRWRFTHERKIGGSKALSVKLFQRVCPAEALAPSYGFQCVG
jgi:hypothetical protein